MNMMHRTLSVSNIKLVRLGNINNTHTLPSRDVITVTLKHNEDVHTNNESDDTDTLVVLHIRAGKIISIEKHDDTISIVQDTFLDTIKKRFMKAFLGNEVDTCTTRVIIMKNRQHIAELYIDNLREKMKLKCIPSVVWESHAICTSSTDSVEHVSTIRNNTDMLYSVLCSDIQDVIHDTYTSEIIVTRHSSSFETRRTSL